MKHRIHALLLCTALLLSLASCGKSAAKDAANDETPPAAAGVSGGWTVVPAQAGPLPEDAQAAFEKAIAAQDDADYTPVALLSTQLVAGTNYCIFCQVTPKGDQAAPFWALVYIYADLQGNAELTNVYDLDIPRHWAPAE